MATLEERISNKKRLIEKKENTINKKRGWIEKKENEIKTTTNANEIKSLEFDIEVLNDDIKRLQNDINNEQKRLDELNTKQKIEQEKACNRNIKPILDFLEQYKQQVINYFLTGIKDHFEAHEKFKQSIDNLKSRCSVYSQMFDDEYKHLKKSIIYPVDGYYDSVNKTQVEGSSSYAKKWIKNSLEQSVKYLEDFMQKDCEAKYDNLVNNIIYYTGKVTDASCLTVGAKGELNGFVTGEKGKVEVHTEQAGGYNIQCYHFRTYVKKI